MNLIIRFWCQLFFFLHSKSGPADAGLAGNIPTALGQCLFWGQLHNVRRAVLQGQRWIYGFQLQRATPSNATEMAAVHAPSTDLTSMVQVLASRTVSKASGDISVVRSISTGGCLLSVLQRYHVWKHCHSMWGRTGTAGDTPPETITTLRYGRPARARDRSPVAATARACRDSTQPLPRAPRTA